MSIRTSFATLATAVVLGAGALVSGSLATSSAAQAAPGWHGGHGHHGHMGHGFHRPGGRWGHGGYWGHRGGFRPVYASGFYGPACYTVLRTRFVPGLGYVERPVTRCR